MGKRKGSGAIPMRVVGTKNNNIVGLGLTVMAGAVLLGAGIHFGDDLALYAKNKLIGVEETNDGLTSSTGAQPGEAGSGSASNTIVVDTRQGVSSTANLNAYDAEANSETEVYPDWVVYELNDDGETAAKIVSGTGANSTTTTKGTELSVSVIGSSYYGDSYEKDRNGQELKSDEVSTFDFDVHSIAAEGSLSTIPKDSFGDTLTAVTNANQSADYEYSMGADSQKRIDLYMSNEQADKLYRLGAVCTFALNDADEYEIADERFVESHLPDELDDASITLSNDDNTSYTVSGFDNCYAVKDGYMDFEEWDSTETFIRGVVSSSSSTDPTADTGDYFGAMFVDIAYEDGADGEVYFDYYKHDNNEKVSDVGLDETETSPQGGTSGVVVELI